MIFALMKGNKGQISLLSLGVWNIHFGTHEAEGHYHRPPVKLASE